jgi:hypothetical protein
MGVGLTDQGKSTVQIFHYFECYMIAMCRQGVCA